MMEKLKLLIDTDLGDEIDDALALYFAMKKGFEMVGITTVFQNTAERARIAKRLLKLYGNGYEAVPVFVGHGTPLAEREREYGHTCHYTSELEKEEYAPDGDGAVDFIIEQCKKWGKELVVVAIGPFTNIAKVIEKDSAALGLAKKVVIMGGAFFKQYAD
jgi:purine nucleosidase/pyrimidine-specific ribonucleoside hydrolase